MIAMIDNYDSFTYNLVQYFGELGQEVEVFRNDQVTVDEIAACVPEYLVISPGPCTPDEAGISVAAIRHFAGKVPVFGVCLGHQGVGQAFGAVITGARAIMHGKLSAIYHRETGIFTGLPNEFTATRYHSLVIQRDTLPQCLEVTAWTDYNEIMAVRHRELAVEGVQFHPESIATEHGHRLLENFLKQV